MIILDIKNQQGQITCDADTLSLIRDKFSIANPAYRKNAKFVAARLYAITPKGKFEVGLLRDIVSYIQLNGYEFTITDKLKEEFTCGFNNPQIKELSLPFRDYQEKSIIASIKQGRGVVVIPTAGGKTLICAGLIESLRQNLKDPEAMVLVTVPSIQLVEQTASDFVNYGLEKVTKWSGNNKLDPNAKIIVAGTQFLLSDKTDLSILADVKILLVDECIRKNTLISTNRGDIKIQNINIGDLVKSFNKNTNKIEYKPILNTWKNLNKSNSYEEFLEIELENGNIVHLTPNHKVYTDKGYKRADELSECDDIFFINSSKWMNLRCKYLYAKTNFETHLLNMWKGIKICFKTFKILPSINIIKTILRQIFKKRIGRVL
jgi:hypothetical protein